MARYKKLRLPKKTALAKTLDEIFADPTAQPEGVPAHSGHHGHGDGAITSRREAEHRGHEIVIETSYRITIDGQPFRGHVEVEDDGALHCHALPYANYPSAVDFVKAIIDIYPDSFTGAPDHDDHAPDHSPDHAPGHDEHHPPAGKGSAKKRSRNKKKKKKDKAANENKAKAKSKKKEKKR